MDEMLESLKAKLEDCRHGISPDTPREVVERDLMLCLRVLQYALDTIGALKQENRNLSESLLNTIRMMRSRDPDNTFGFYDAEPTAMFEALQKKVGGQ